MYTLEQYLLEHTRGFRLVTLVATLLLLLTWQAHGAEPTLQDTRPAPRAFFAVMQCDELVSGWIITQDGKAYRTDAMNHPDTPAEYMAFLRWAQSAVSVDVYTIPCADRTAHK